MKERKRSRPIEPDLRASWENHDGVSLRANVFFPTAGENNEHKCPIFWIVPGGGFVQNDLDDYPRGLVNKVRALGWLVCITCYSTLPETPVVEILEEVVESGIWVRSELQEFISDNFLETGRDIRLSPKIIACALSAGAYYTLLAAMAPPARTHGYQPPLQLHALILFYGCFDPNVKFPDRGRLSRQNNFQPELTPELFAEATDYEDIPEPGVPCFPERPSKLEARKSFFFYLQQHEQILTLLLGSYRGDNGDFVIPNKEEIPEQNINDWNPIHRIESGRDELLCHVVVVEATMDEIFDGHGSRLAKAIGVKGGTVDLVKVHDGHAFDVSEGTEAQIQYLSPIYDLVLRCSGMHVDSTVPTGMYSTASTEIMRRDDAWHCWMRNTQTGGSKDAL